MKIENIEDLKILEKQISKTRLKLKREPSGSFWFDSNRKKAYEAIVDENESAYSELPSEIPVSSVMKKLLVNLFVDNLKARYELDEKHPTNKHKTKIAINSLAVIFAPSPGTIASLTETLLEANSDISQYHKGLKELARKVDKNMQVVLGSYQLTKKSNGSFVLKRGSWSVNEYRDIPDGRTPTRIIFQTAVNDVGIDRGLLVPSQRHLIDDYEDSPQRSPNIGRW